MRLLRIIGLRLLIAIPTLFLVSLGAFALVLLLPGKPAQTLAGGDLATPERIAEVRTDLGLDDPLVEQYTRWLGDALAFDFGTSLTNGADVGDTLVERTPATLSIALAGIVVALTIGLTTGIIAGSRPGSAGDKVSIGVATAGVAIPYFVVAIVLVRLFAIEWRLFPAVRYTDISESFVGWLESIILPGIALGFLGAGALSRQLRAALVGEARSDYVRTSWAIGSGASTATGKHALRNSAVPALAVLGTQLTFMLGGAVIVEQIFAINGIGTYAYQAALTSDLPAIRGVIMWFAIVQVGLFLLIDITLVVLNPRIAVK